jgi:hypothetical protein
MSRLILQRRLAADVTDADSVGRRPTAEESTVRWRFAMEV